MRLSLLLLLLPLFWMLLLFWNDRESQDFSQAFFSGLHFWLRLWWFVLLFLLRCCGVRTACQPHNTAPKF